MSTNTNPRWDAAANGLPTWRDLFHGCVRESLAAAYSVARLGLQETRAWERPMSYVADDNQGNVGVVDFLADGAVGAVSARVQEHPFDRAGVIEAAPTALRDALRSVCERPLLQEGPGVSTAFWTVGEFVHSLDDWGDTWLRGAELFRREFLSDSRWGGEGTRYYGLTWQATQLAVAIADRAVARAPMAKLTESELWTLVPRGSKYEATALDLLTSDGLFEIARDSTA